MWGENRSNSPASLSRRFLLRQMSISVIAFLVQHVSRSASFRSLSAPPRPGLSHPRSGRKALSSWGSCEQRFVEPFQWSCHSLHFPRKPIGEQAPLTKSRHLTCVSGNYLSPGPSGRRRGNYSSELSGQSELPFGRRNASTGGRFTSAILAWPCWAAHLSAPKIGAYDALPSRRRFCVFWESAAFSKIGCYPRRPEGMATDLGRSPAAKAFRLIMSSALLRLSGFSVSVFVFPLAERKRGGLGSPSNSGCLEIGIEVCLGLMVCRNLFRARTELAGFIGSTPFRTR